MLKSNEVDVTQLCKLITARNSFSVTEKLSEAKAYLDIPNEPVRSKIPSLILEDIRRQVSTGDNNRPSHKLSSDFHDQTDWYDWYDWGDWGDWNDWCDWYDWYWCDWYNAAWNDWCDWENYWCNSW